VQSEPFREKAMDLGGKSGNVKGMAGTGNMRKRYGKHGFIRVYEEYKDGEGVAAGGADASEDPR